MNLRPRIGLFVTCLVDLFQPSVGFATVKLLEDAGCDVEVPPAQTCCGQPAFNSGDRADTRFEGGFGIYDAPEPWGPWTTAYYSEKWDVGPGETASLPTKWMDGNTLYLVFSGNDNFCVRRASLVLGKEGF